MTPVEPEWSGVVGREVRRLLSEVLIEVATALRDAVIRELVSPGTMQHVQPTPTGTAAALRSAVQGRATLTVADAAEILGISRASAYQAVRDGDLPAIRVGRRLVLPVDRLAQWLDGTGSDDG